MMKKTILIVSIMFGLSSCSDNLEDLNANIKDPASVPGESLFTGAQKNIVDQVVDLNVNNNNTKLWSQFLQETTYTDESNYDQVTRTIPEEHWSVFYRDVLRDLNEAEKIISETTYVSPEHLNTNNKLMIIEIMRVYSYSILVETFGDVPYSEAIDIDNLLPAYEDGLTIYEDLIDRLTLAMNGLETGRGSFGLSDNIYQGDTSSWLKFAASLKLRMGILIADIDSSLAESTIESAISTGVFTSNADNAAFQYLSAAPNTNPVHANLVLSGRNDFVAGATLVEIMQPRDYEYLEDTDEDGDIDTDDARTVVPGSATITDPRMAYYFDSNVDADPTVEQTVYLGGEIGSPSTFSSYTHVSARIESATEPGIILDYAEVEFLMAEAAARGYTTGATAAEHYASGITASIEFWGGTEAEAIDYLALPTVDYATLIGTQTWKEVIGTQRWIALFNRGLEAWTSIRRMDFPVMATPTEAVSGFPNRYTYPIVEQTLNSENYNAASSAIGGDLAETKLFFDVY